MKAEIDLLSPTWRAIRERAELRLDELRRKNDAELDEMQTAKLRGRIAELKELLALDRPAPANMMDEAR